jgi:hypothetical protein
MRRTPIDEGMSLFVGTVSPDGLPAGCRAIAATSPDQLKTITVYLPMATSRDVVANIASTKKLAIVGTWPPDHSAMQLKGTTTAVRLANDDEREFLDYRIDRFADVLHAIGIPRRLAKALNHWPAFAVDMKVEEVFEQTPGPNAGNQLR